MQLPLSSDPLGRAGSIRVCLLMVLMAGAALSGCATYRAPNLEAADVAPADAEEVRASPSNVPVREVPRISGSVVGAQYPSGWSEWLFHAGKRKTEYRVVQADGQVVLRAESDASASGVKVDVDIDPHRYPLFSFRFCVDALIPGADLSDRYASDSPVRVAVSVDGDKSTLPFRDQLHFEQARLLGGQEMPYATLVYVWDNTLPVESVVANHYTQRIRKLVVASGSEGVGRWLEFRRNVLDDFQRVFGEPPGRVTRIVLMSDSDNTKERVRAYYGDLGFSQR